MIVFRQLFWLQVIASGAGLVAEAAHVKFDFQKSASTRRLTRRADYLQVPLPEDPSDAFYAVNVSIGTPPQVIPTRKSHND